MAVGYHFYHISLLCRIQQDKEHEPCHSQTCDRNEDCNEPCMCLCHKKVPVDIVKPDEIMPPGSRTMLHNSQIGWHGDELHYIPVDEW